MRYTRWIAFLGTPLFLLTVGQALARPLFTIPTATPEDFQQDVEQMVYDKIPEELNGAQCGGWNMNQSVSGKIARVFEVPGRETTWDGAITSGMATRTDLTMNNNPDDDFLYPDSAVGLGTTCQSNTKVERRVVWRPDASGILVPTRVDFPSPYFEDPTCRWRLSGGSAYPPVPLPDNGTLDYEELQDPPQDRQSPPVCGDFCTYLNRFMYLDCMQPAGDQCLEWRLKFLCTDQWVPDTWDEDVNSYICGEQNPKVEIPDTSPNSQYCKGQECRCSEGSNMPGCEHAPNGVPYYSYYRRYNEASFARDPVPTDNGQDDYGKNAQVACYGIYNEFDPKYQQTHYQDRRCIINMDVGNMRQSQRGKGTFGQATNLPDPNPGKNAAQRDEGRYEEDTDLWFQKLGHGFSLLSEKIFDENYDSNLTNVYLDTDKLDSAQMSAANQLTQGQPFAKTNELRAFDDTGEDRVVVQWWQKQEKEVNELLHRPAIRLILPASWALGLDSDDPLFKKQTVLPPPEGGTRGERIEVQIDADDDSLGAVMAHVERSLLLRVEEEKIPLVVPLGSPTEFRQRAQSWCSWLMRKTGNKNCTDSVPGNMQPVMDVIQKTERYADEIEQVRTLRTELVKYAGDALALQQALLAPISQWMTENINLYKRFTAERQNFEGIIRDMWRPIQEQFNAFNDETNMPWCMNQRFTAPVYSLLDEWLQSRFLDDGVGGDRTGLISADGMPNLDMKRSSDLIIDFSSISYMTGAILFPVLEPIQVSIADIPAPPAITEEHGLPDDPLPNLPSIEDIRRAFREKSKLPTFNSTFTPPPLIAPPADEIDVADVEARFSAISNIIYSMDTAYKKFWDSLAPQRPADYGDLSEIQSLKENLECKQWDAGACVHVEMDLMERFVRIGSRPEIALQEDWDSAGWPRTFPAACPTGDHVCLLLHSEETPPKRLWKLIPPRTQLNFYEDLKSAIRSLTLPVPVGDMPEEDVPTYNVDLKELLPIHEVPRPIDLSPNAASSSSAP